MYKNYAVIDFPKDLENVSILVLMELCIKTDLLFRRKNDQKVSILVLMELCIKTHLFLLRAYLLKMVSILVLMELCIKT